MGTGARSRSQPTSSAKTAGLARRPDVVGRGHDGRRREAQRMARVVVLAEGARDRREAIAPQRRRRRVRRAFRRGDGEAADVVGQGGGGAVVGAGREAIPTAPITLTLIEAPP
jgi:hypothetical protein